MGLHQAIEVANIGVAELAPAVAGDVLAIVMSNRVPRKPDGQPLGYEYDVSRDVDVIRILDISHMNVVASLEDGSQLKPHFASLYYRRKGRNVYPHPTFKILLPRMRYAAKRPKDIIAASYAVGEDGAFTIRRSGQGELTADIRVVGFNEDPAGFTPRPASVPLPPRVSPPPRANLRFSPVTRITKTDLHIERGRWFSSDDEHGIMAVRLMSRLSIRHGEERASTIVAADLLEERQRRAQHP